MRTVLRRWNRVTNAVSTLLTVLTGLRENAILLRFVGRFAHVRSRLARGQINYGIARLDAVPERSLPDLVHVGTTYNFHRAPERTLVNLGEDRSVCLRVNSMTATSLAHHYDDAFGERVRREQVFLYSISAPHCEVVNLDPRWLHDHCVAAMFRGNATACHEFIFLNFDTLQRRRDILAGGRTRGLWCPRRAVPQVP